jgi:hypothetical protein
VDRHEGRHRDMQLPLPICEDSPEVVADGREDGIGGVSGTTFEIAATEVILGFHVADHGLDGGASSQFAFDDAGSAGPDACAGCAVLDGGG